MMGLGSICGGLFVMIGLGTLLSFGIFVLSFNTIVKLAAPVAIGGLPMNRTFSLWSSIPLETAINVSLINAFALNTPVNNSLTTGRMEFKIQLSDEDWNADELYPILHLQEDGELGEVVRGMQIYSEGPINYAKPIAILLGLGCFAFAGYVILLAMVVKKPD